MTLSGGVELATVGMQGLPPGWAMAQVQPVVIDENEPMNPAVNYEMYIGPPLLFFFLHLFVLVLAATYLIPPRRKPAWFERLASFAAIITVGMAIGLLFFNVYLPAIAVVPASSTFVLMTSLFALLVLDCMLAWGISRLLFFEPVMGFEAVILLGMLSLMFSGVTWPTDMFPPAFRVASYVNPFTPFAKGMRSMIPLQVDMSHLSDMYRMFGVEAALFAAFGAAGSVVEWIIARARRRTA
jgi:ABC-2 type transport system permease protein